MVFHIHSSRKAANSPGTNNAQRDPIIAADRAARADVQVKHPVPTLESMPGSEEELPPYPDPEISSIALEGKMPAKIHYTYYPASPSQHNHPNPFSQSLVVFLNGLMLPRSSWEPTIQSFLEKRIVGRLPYPAMLSYDRYGQGESDGDPTDKQPSDGHGHDIMSAVRDLKQLTLQIWRERLEISNPTHYPCLIFVCNSIGCAIARLFTQTYPGTVCGMLFLDSIIANSDYTDIWPNPDAPNFDPNTLPPGVTADEVRETREKYRSMFHPSVPNREGLSRRNLAALLPDADGPRLEGYNGDGPCLTVVGHDWETFAEQSFAGTMHTPKTLTMTYANPAWQRYNEGLTRITDEGKAIGPIIALNCGHFTQKDGPRFVSDEMVSLLDRVVNRVDQVSERERYKIVDELQHPEIRREMVRHSTEYGI